ncbi:hypothetical protein RFI_35036 [Reticulomyxa filosa]|uniref:Uncharacterized protein n=1 Tax=Reticulomyxa filosa TaxID=46433 RepID=X6LM41_RETFI|nr:hypothetical protein RFI_35036 [Reticulomyxa filosa]|eukprot:ETO02401.1 hypothetical protein RFI_35036 [Reticulomyxa filosa]
MRISKSGENGHENENIELVFIHKDNYREHKYYANFGQHKSHCKFHKRTKKNIHKSTKMLTFTVRGNYMLIPNNWALQLLGCTFYFSCNWDVDLFCLQYIKIEKKVTFETVTISNFMRNIINKKKKYNKILVFFFWKVNEIKRYQKLITVFVLFFCSLDFHK